MEWIEDTSARWRTILSPAGRESSPLDAGVRLVQEAVEDVRAQERPKRFGRDHRRPEAELVTVLGRHVVTGLALGDHLLSALAAATGRSREELLSDIPISATGSAPAEQLHRLRIELASGCAELHAARDAPAFAQLSERVARILALAQEEAAHLAAPEC
jgi:hypothetical protein